MAHRALSFRRWEWVTWPALEVSKGESLSRYTYLSHNMIISDLGLGKMVSTLKEGYSGSVYIKVLTLFVWQTHNANNLKTCLNWVNHRRFHYNYTLCLPSVLILLHLHKRGPAPEHSRAWDEFSFTYKSVGFEGCTDLQITSGSGCGGACT